MDTYGDLPLVGQLIEQAREHVGISQNEAARRAGGMTGTRWRQIVERDASTMRSKRGVERLALMAEVVGVTPEQFVEIDREDVAEKLRTKQRAESAPTMDELRARVEQSEARAERLEASQAALIEAMRDALGAEAVEGLQDSLGEGHRNAS
jgi:transcriptional regulator with XRE-family HTH domain